MALSFQNKLIEKSKEITKIQKEKETLEAQIAREQKKQEELAKEIQKMQTLADEKIRVMQLINEHYSLIYNYLKNKNYKKALIEVEKLLNFLENKKEIVVLSNEEILNNKLISNQLIQTIQFYINKNKENYEKSLLLQKGNEYIKRNEYNKAYNSYFNAFTKYSSLTGSEKYALNNIKNLMIMELENKSNEFLKEINILIQSNKLENALMKTQQFISENINLSFYQKVILLKNNLIERIKIENMNKIVEKLYDEASEKYKLGQLQTSKEKLLNILKEYPESSYTSKIIELIINIDSQLKKAKPEETKKEISEETIQITGRILQTFGNYILFSTNQALNLKVGDILKIYTLSKNIYRYIGSIRIIEYSNGFGKGVIIYKEENIKIGDFLSSE